MVALQDGTFLDGLSLVAQVFLYASFLALINERVIEFLIKPLLKRYSLEFWTPYIALVTGGAASIAFGVDLLQPVAIAVGLVPLVPWVGLVLSGIIIGGGSNLLHDIWGTWRQ